jgi:hypothetical protein
MQHEVVVVAHLAVGQHLRVETVHGVRQDIQLRLAIGVVNVDGLAPVAAGGDVVDSAGEFEAERPGHGRSLGGEGQKARPDPVLCAVSLRGDWVGAGLSLASAIPFAGWGATAAKAGRKVVKASGEAGAKAAKEAAERAAKEAAEKAEKEAAEKAAKEKGGKVKPKPKPKCGQSGPYKDRKNHDNDGMNWDHVPSQKALLERALRENRGRPLSQGQIDSIIENAPAIAIPKGLHQKASESFGGRQHQSVDGVRRPMRDAQDLQRATQENTQAILDQIDAYDPGCKGAYRSATQELVKRTDAEWAAWLKQVMRDSK